MKTNNDQEFITKLIQLLPNAVSTPHSRLAGSMMVESTWIELLSLQFIGARCLQLGIPYVAADRADAAYDVVVNVGHRVQVKATRTGSGRCRLHRRHRDRERGIDVYRPYRATDFDLLMLILLPSNDVGGIGTWIIPMEQLRRQGLVSYYNENGILTIGSAEMSIDLHLLTGLYLPFREA